MSGLVGGILIASATFIGTMFDDAVALTAQLRLTEAQRHRRVAWAHALAVGSLVIVAAGVASVLTAIPLRLVGLMAVIPWAHAIYAWRHATARVEHRRGVVTTYTLTLTRGGSRLAVWIPILRAGDLAQALVTVAIFALGELLLVVLTRTFSRREGSATATPHWTSRASAALYVALGVLVVVVCRTF